MKELIDIHSHILMDVDDGANDLEESIKMLKIAWREKISDIILTPHYINGDKSEAYAKVNEKIDKLRMVLKNENIPIRLYRGNELLYSRDLVLDIETGRASTLPDGNDDVLVEFSHLSDIQYMKSGFYQLICNGYKPILAHTERYDCLFTKNDRIMKLKEWGVLFQVNASSIMGKNGFKYKKRARDLLKDNLIDYIATDAHDGKRRTPKLRTCAKYVEKKYGKERYQKIFYDNPEKLLCSIKNKEI